MSHELAIIMTTYGSGTFSPALYASIVAVDVVLLVIGTTLFYINRHQPMIKFRSWAVNLTICFMLCSFEFVNALAEFEGVLTYDNAFIAFGMRDFFIFICVAGCPSVIFRHFCLIKLPVIQKEFQDNRDTYTVEDKVKLNRKLRIVKFFSTELGSWVMMVPLALFNALIFTISMAYTDKDDYLLTLRTPLRVALFATLSTEFVLAILLFWWCAVKGGNDNFYVKQQFGLMLLSSICAYFFGAMKSFTKNNVVSNAFTLVYHVFLMITIAVDVLIPLYFIYFKFRYKTRFAFNFNGYSAAPMMRKSHANDSMIERNKSTATFEKANNSGPSISRKNTNRTNLQTVLNDPKLKEAFCKYLVQEFSLESLLFIEAVERFKKQFDAQKEQSVVVEIEKIMNEFMKPSSINEVNLPRQISKTIQSEIDHMRETKNFDKGSEVFDVALHHISEMLTINHVRKFIMTKADFS